MSVSLFHRYFCNLLWNKKWPILSWQMLYRVRRAHPSISRANTAVYHFTKAQKLRACNAWNKSTVPIHHITLLRVLAGKDLHESMIFILFRSSFHVSLTVHDSIVYKNSMLLSLWVILYRVKINDLSVLIKTSLGLLFNSLILLAVYSVLVIFLIVLT